MKKVALAVVAGLAMVLIFPLSVSAAAAQTDVSGTVTLNGHAVKNAKVTVVCNGHTKHTKTNASGTYLVDFTAKNCPAGDSITVSAMQGKDSGSNAGTAHSVTTKLNIALINVSLPEMGLVASGIAVVAAGGVFAIVRKRNIAQQ